MKIGSAIVSSSAFGGLMRIDVKETYPKKLDVDFRVDEADQLSRNVIASLG